MNTLFVKINRKESGHKLEFWQLDINGVNDPKIEKFSNIAGLFFAESKIWHVYIDGKFHKIYRGKKKDLTTKNGILVSVEENHDVFPWLIYNKLSHYTFVSPVLTENDYKNWQAGFFSIFHAGEDVGMKTKVRQLVDWPKFDPNGMVDLVDLPGIEEYYQKREELLFKLKP
jgi:hypothetical protein